MFRNIIEKTSKAPRKIVVVLITAYGYFISPILKPRCRFIPTCSEYGKEAIIKFGVVKGGWLLLKRLLKCHPLCKGGVDLVPDKNKRDSDG
ncbi:MAG: membrane protein insertion efficiency factor YidD [Gammaproteobacteria bacterium]|nr:membrane protein insertion efficiency factor YidD [Gammaproteobacteria bacterium]